MVTFAPLCEQGRSLSLPRTHQERPVEDTARPKRVWSTPKLRRYDLTNKELDQLRAAEDPMRELLAMKPELKSEPS